MKQRGIVFLCIAALGINATWTSLSEAYDPGRPCFDNTECQGLNQFCQKTPGDCTGQGSCEPMPENCLMIFDPVCGCDGNTYGNDCQAAAAGVNVAYQGECRIGGGCESNIDCADPAEYCAKVLGDCNGQGVCKPRPELCLMIFDPVCGCDGATYSNDCEAAAAGVNVVYKGECITAETPCLSNSDCTGPAEYCAKVPGDCAGLGVCEPRPELCLMVLDPVCGCDGATYGNDCEAAAAGVNVEYQGECM